MSTMAIIGLIVIILGVIFLGEPLYVLIGAVAVWCLATSGVLERLDLLSTTIIGETRGLSDNPVLLAIPFFVIAGALMTEGDIAKRLIEFAKALFGWIPGGLAIAAVCACIFFAAISGSSPVTVIAIGTIMYPALLKEKYPDSFSTGLVTSAGSLGILIPPSIPMIVYAIVDPTQFVDPPGYTLTDRGASVAELFVAGLGPGLLIGLALSGYAMYTGWVNKVPRTEIPRSKLIARVLLLVDAPVGTLALLWFGVLDQPIALACHALVQGVLVFVGWYGTEDGREVLRTFVRGFWALMLPVIILGGIYSGLFSPTQAAAVSVVYAFVVEYWIHKSITLDDLPRLLSESAVLMGTLLIIMALALGFNRYLELAQIPEAAVELIREWDLSLFAFLFILNILLLIVGCLMDILSAILILVPLLAKVGAGLGVHPLHLAVIFIVNLEIGYLTPPVGLNLFVSSTIFRKDLGDVIRSVLPFMLLMLGCLLMITYIPTISLGPVALMRSKPAIVNFPEPKKAKPGKPTEDGKKQEINSELDDLMDDLGYDEGEEEGGGSELDELMDEVEEEMEEEGGGSELDELMDEVEEEIAEEEEAAEDAAAEEGEAPAE